MIYPKLSDGTIDWCVMCKHEGSDVYDGCCECEYPENSDENSDDPPTKYEPKPQTNADRIRSMSDEELAEFFTPFYYDGPKFYCPAQADVGEGECAAKSDCRQCWLDWLKQEEQNDSP